MLETRKIISIGEAAHAIMTHQKCGTIEHVPLMACEGRFLAKDMIATCDLPHFTRSAFDGFAVRAEDTASARPEKPLTLEVVDHIGAGMVTDKIVTTNQAVRIMTGAQMPAECDAVVALELAKEFQKDGKTFVTIKRAAKIGDHISYQGEETKLGTTLVTKGTRIHAGISASLATFGYETVPVAKKPVVGILATGSELLEVSDPLVPGKIRNSNTSMIVAQIHKIGGKAIYFGKLADDFETSYQKINEAFAKVDFLITTGGVSVGDYDLMPDVYQKMNAHILFNKVAMRPGSVTTVAEKDGKLIFGLSGNPSACYVGLELFVRPSIRAMLFSSAPHLQKITAYLGSDFTKPNPFTRFIRSELGFRDGKVFANPVGIDKSNIILSLIKANSLAVLPGGTRGFQAGDQVEVLLIDDHEGSEWPW